MHTPPTSNGSDSSDAPGPNEAAPLYDPNPSSRFSLWALLRRLWNGKWLILGVALLWAGGSYAYWTAQPKMYSTDAMLMRDEPEQLDEVGISLSTDRPDRTARTLHFLRYSNVFAEQVAQRLRARADSVSASEGTLLYDADGRLRSVDGLAGRVQANVNIQTAGAEVPAVKISLKSPYPSEAAFVTNTYAETYVDHLRKKSSARLRRSRQYIEQQRSELQKRLRRLEDSVSTKVRAQGRAGLLATGDSTGGILNDAHQLARSISDLRRQREKVQLELNVEQAMLDSTRARLSRIRPNLASRASSNTADRLKQTQEEIAALERRIQQIRVRNDDLPPDLQAKLEEKRARVNTLRKKAEQLADAYVQEALATDAVSPLGEEGSGLSTVVDLRRQLTNRRIRITKLEARRSALSDRIDSREARLRQSPDRSLARLKRRKNTTEELYTSLSKSLQKIQVSEESTPDKVQILQRAQPPSRPVGPDVKTNVIMALLLGGLLGGGLVLLINTADDRIEKPADLEQYGDGLFGSVPPWSPELTDGDSGADADVPAQLNHIAATCSPAAEAYRHIATNLRLGVPNDMNHLLVTSPAPADGKSTTTANLGVALSEAGLDVLLVDLDLHGPTLHHKMGCGRTPGVSEALTQSSPEVRTFRTGNSSHSGDGAPCLLPSLDERHRKHMGRLGLLSAGQSVPQPSLLLQERPVRDLLHDLSPKWDVIVLDSPPVLSYDAPSRLAALSDMALLVARAHEITNQAYGEAADRLAPLCSGPIAGVLNQYDGSQADVYGYGSSTYADSYSSDTPVKQVLQHVKRGAQRIAKGR